MHGSPDRAPGSVLRQVIDTVDEHARVAGRAPDHVSLAAAHLHDIHAAFNRGANDQRQSRILPRHQHQHHRTTPSAGLLADAYGSTGMRPARDAARPASTPSRIARAISAGSCARAIAVLTRHAAAPSSIAVAASEGTPMPASTTTGTFACSTMMRIASNVFIPCPLPIGDASGITVALPISCSFSASTGSALMYGSTTKPSSTRTLHASSVPTGSGSRYFGSGMTSTLIQSDSPIARAMRAVRIASSAVRAPAVFGRMW